jgi:hypothetical protein
MQQVDHDVGPIDQGACSIVEEFASSMTRTLTRAHRIAVVFEGRHNGRWKRSRLTLQEDPDS